MKVLATYEIGKLGMCLLDIVKNWLKIRAYRLIIEIFTWVFNLNYQGNKYQPTSNIAEGFAFFFFQEEMFIYIICKKD